jgi:D-alanyl-D-alanine dipeptidase
LENRLIILILISLLLVGCASESNPESSSEPEQIKSTHSEASFNEEAESSETESDSVESEGSTEKEESVEYEESVEPLPLPLDSDLVLISDYIPDIKTDIRYATENNFTGKVIYNSDKAYLRYGTVKKLLAVQNELKESGYELLIWDAYRPTEAQWKLWEICPDPSFVSNPNNGYSSHSRGNTVDITIVRTDGSKVEMPSEFDEFTKLADRDYSDVSKEAAENSQFLEDIMEKHGFSGYKNEWWHYSDTVKYDVVI